MLYCLLILSISEMKLHKKSSNLIILSDPIGINGQITSRDKILSPRISLRGQTRDKNVEKIGITKENTFPKTIILPYLSRF